MAMDASETTSAIISTGSTATLDLQDVLSSFSGECLLSTSLSLVSNSESVHSFDDVPPFPDAAKPLVFTAELGTSLLGPLSSTSAASRCDLRLLTTVPTGPRLRVMMLEPASLDGWAASVPSLSGPSCPLDDCTVDEHTTVEASMWISEGSLFSPEVFHTMLRKRLSRAEEDASALHDDRESSDSSPDLKLVGISASSSSASGSLSDDCLVGEGLEEVNAAAPLLVPTIMISNSTAALPLSLESSHSLHPELPLAVRRGKQLPSALSLDPKTKSALNNPCDPYPDIPTAFLGSPTTCTPTAEIHHESCESSMGLSAMCADLRSRLPAPPFTPTEPIASPYCGPSVGDDVIASPQSSVSSDLDDEEWAFARDLVIDWHAGEGFRMELSPPPSPAGDLPYASDPESPSIDDSFARSQTLVAEFIGNSSTDEDDPVRTPMDVKLTRRKTVIIQAPEPSHREKYRSENVHSVVAESAADVLSSELHEPVPFETPSSAPTPAVASADCDCSCQQPSFSPGSRPSSTASMRPVRGILKEKKSVRFSTVDFLHEYLSPSHAPAPHSFNDAGAVSHGSDPSRLQPEAVVRARRTTLTSEVRKSSPLRRCYSPTTYAGDTAGRHPRSHSLLSGEVRDLSPFGGGSMAKHPAVRAMARRPSASSPQTPTPAPFVGSGVDGAVIGAPSLQGPTPIPLLLGEQGRVPLRSINPLQSMPAERRADVPVPVKPSAQRSLLSKQRDGAAADKARRVLKSTSVPPAPRLERDENAHRRSEAVVAGKESRSLAGASAGTSMGGKSRMSAPLRSILTKLRT
ncbi:hypothetical protein BD414DRAFT_455072 [Trametes punicea]|nr:hypothetical protein BD414DRAFT_455072 [Trametes punicea]